LEYFSSFVVGESPWEVDLENRRDLPGLFQHAQSWVKAEPKDYLGWLCLGNAHGKQKQTAKAMEACQQALRINPQFAEAWTNLGFS
jgi:cytochrome c-type biogenesis protein CcmH/NrfG